MGSTEVPGLAALVSHASGLATKPARLSGVGGGRILGGLNGSLRPQAKVLPHAARSIFSDLNPTALADAITKSLVSGFFHSLLGWVSDGAASLVGVLGNALSSSTAPVLSSSAFGSEFGLMVMLSGAVALPLVAVGAIQSNRAPRTQHTLAQRAHTPSVGSVVHRRERASRGPRLDRNGPGQRALDRSRR